MQSDIERKFSNLTQTQKAGLNEVLEMLELYTCAGKALYSNLIASGRKLSFYIDPTSTSAGSYDPTTRKIKFKSESDINLDVVSEELFHAYQDLFYPGGTSNYVLSGRINIEFEAKLFHDIMYVNTPLRYNLPSCCGTVNNSQEGNYLAWLQSITDQGTKYPSRYNVMGGQYWYYMSQFDSSWPSYPGDINASFQPGAIFQLIDSSSCTKKTN